MAPLPRCLLPSCPESWPRHVLITTNFIALFKQVPILRCSNGPRPQEHPLRLNIPYTQAHTDQGINGMSPLGWVELAC